MHLRTILLIAVLGLGVLACSQSEQGYSTQAAEKEMAAYEEELDMDQTPPMTEDASPPPPETVPERVLLRNANCRLEVEKISERVKQIERLIGKKNGYLGDLNWRHYPYQEEVTMTLRVPADEFQWVLDSIMKLAASVDYQQVTTQDVTEEYVDIQSRLKTKKAVRDRYEEILRTKAKTVEEILLAEEQIRRLQEEIEAQEGRLRYLSQRAALSTIQLELYEPLEEQAQTPWWKSFGEDIGDSLGFSMDLLKGLFLGIISIWPLLLLLALFIWRRKAIWKKLSGSDKAANEN